MSEFQPAAQHTVAAQIEATAEYFESADLHFGHGTGNARDEAAWLVLQAMNLPLDGSFDDWGRQVDEESARRIRQIATRRVREEVPLAYLLGSAWFAGMEFSVTAEVLVPRSPIAELILDGFQPWIDPGKSLRVLDLCTGSGCIAIATAMHLPQAQVDATDISASALRIAAENVARHGLENRVRLIESDLFDSVPTRKYDLVVTNPPYVSRESMRQLPAEYRAEPALGLQSGLDGLDAALTIMLDAPGFLGEDGVLICEVGESESRLVDALPQVPFLWLEFAAGGSGVFLLEKQPLSEARPALLKLMENRKNVA